MKAHWVEKGNDFALNSRGKLTVLGIDVITVTRCSLDEVSFMLPGKVREKRSL